QLRQQIMQLPLSTDQRANLQKRIDAFEKRLQRLSQAQLAKPQTHAPLQQVLKFHGLLADLGLTADPYLQAAIQLRQSLRTQFDQFTSQQRQILGDLLPYFTDQLQPLTLLEWPADQEAFKQSLLDKDQPKSLRVTDKLFKRLNE